MTLLQVTDLCAGYGNEQVLFGVSLSVDDGEVVALLGSRGAGRTTTLRAISGLVRPTSGAVALDGRTVTGSSPEGVVLVDGRGPLPEVTGSPRLLLVDEASEPALAQLADVNRATGVAVLVVAQDVGALDLADRAYVLEGGQVVAAAAGAGVRAMQGRLRAAYLRTERA